MRARRWDVISDHRAGFGVKRLCGVLGVSRSSSHAWREGEAARRARRAADGTLAHEITVVHIASRHTYKIPRIHAELHRLGRA
ncbi:hypothetical protein ACFV2D_37435 [Streptomyces capillispiralis]|uniref:hypothetical protein n=1 Tax=Streptomyces capillispiralis TaxID=68182 RepID=UPI00367DB9D8